MQLLSLRESRPRPRNSRLAKSLPLPHEASVQAAPVGGMRRRRVLTPEATAAAYRAASQVAAGQSSRPTGFDRLDPNYPSQAGAALRHFGIPEPRPAPPVRCVAGIPLESFICR